MATAYRSPCIRYAWAARKSIQAAGSAHRPADGVLICPFHHRRAHDDNWQARLATDGHIEWKRPGDTTWQRNHRWRP